MATLINLILAIACLFLGALVVQDIYTWFVVPLGAPTLNYWHVFGLLNFKALMVYGLMKKEEDNSSEQALAKLLSYLIFLLFIWASGGFASWMMI